MKKLLILSTCLMVLWGCSGVTVMHDPKSGSVVDCQNNESLTFGKDSLDCVEAYKKLGYQEVQP